MTIRYDSKRNAWIIDDVSEVTGAMFNNLLRWGQPYSPYDTGLFRHDVYDAGLDSLPTMIFDNRDVLTNGFGQNVQLLDFDVVKKLKRNKTELGDGSYTLKQLQTKGLSKTGHRGDHVIGTNLYLNQGRLGVSPRLGSDNAAYIFGSILFRLSEDTVFTFRDGRLTGARGRLELGEDNFDHESKNIPPLVSVGVHAAVGDHQNYEKVKMLFEGPGKELTFGNFDPDKNIGKVQGQSDSLGLQRQPSLQLDPTVHRLLSGDLSALDPEKGPFSPNLLRMLMGGKVPRVKGAIRLHDIARPPANRFDR